MELLPVFVAGVVTFFAPCSLPLLPVYIGVIAGENDREGYRRRSIINATLFITGFTIVFVTFGLFAAALGQLLGAGYRTTLSQLGGLIMIVFALMMLDVLRFPSIGINNLVTRFKLPSGKATTAFVLGISLGVGWTPCIGPVLGSVLTLAANQTDTIRSIFLLLVFSAGLALPFLLVAFGSTRLLQLTLSSKRLFALIYKLAGILLLFIGLLMLTNNLGIIVQATFRIFEFVDYDRILNLL